MGDLHIDVDAFAIPIGVIVDVSSSNDEKMVAMGIPEDRRCSGCRELLTKKPLDGCVVCSR